MDYNTWDSQTANGGVDREVVIIDNMSTSFLTSGGSRFGFVLCHATDAISPSQISHPCSSPHSRLTIPFFRLIPIPKPKFASGFPEAVGSDWPAAVDAWKLSAPLRRGSRKNSGMTINSARPTAVALWLFGRIHGGNFQFTNQLSCLSVKPSVSSEANTQRHMTAAAQLETRKSTTVRPTEIRRRMSLDWRMYFPLLVRRRPVPSRAW